MRYHFQDNGTFVTVIVPPKSNYDNSVTFRFYDNLSTRNTHVCDRKQAAELLRYYRNNWQQTNSGLYRRTYKDPKIFAEIVS